MSVDFKKLEKEVYNPQVLIEITSKCNFSCPFCAYPSMERRKMHMPMTLFKHIVHQLPKLTSHQVLLDIAGEPTLHPEFQKMASMINATGLGVRLFTNGSMLKKNYLAIEGLQIISINGDPSHFKMRCPNGNFEKYMNRVGEYLSHWNSKSTRSDIVLSVLYPVPETSDEVVLIKKTLRFFLKKFLIKYQILPVSYVKADITADMYLFFKNSTGKKFMVTLSPILYGGGYPSQHGRKVSSTHEGFCDSAWRRVCIRADGHIGVCCNEVEHACAFTRDENEIWKTPIKELWLNHKNILKIREQFKQRRPPGRCRQCLTAFDNNEKLSIYGGYNWFPPG